MQDNKENTEEARARHYTMVVAPGKKMPGALE
jgi:hypothetical protein